MKKLESTLTNMLLSLGCITIVAAAALAGANLLTQDTIAKAAAEKQTKAISSVLPEHDSIAAPEDHDGIITYKAISSVLPEHDSIAAPEEHDGIIIYKAYKDNQFVGAAVKANDKNGFNGLIEVMVGFDAANTIVGYEVLTQNETPGLGAKMPAWFKSGKGSIIGKQATGNFTVSKDGGDVDAITAATISSRAFLRTINAAYAALNEQDVNAASGASEQAELNEDELQPVVDADETTTNEEKEANNE